MANTKSAKKAIRVSERKRVINLRKKREYREAKKAVVKAVLAKDKSLAQSSLSLAYKAIDKAAKGNVLHKNTAARYKAQLAKMLKSL